MISHKSLATRLAIAAAIANLLLFICPPAHADQSGWSGAAQQHRWRDAPAPMHQGDQRNRCLAKETFTQRLEFANLDRARRVLALPDAWARQLSDFDRGARLHTLDPTSTHQFLRFASDAALTWTAAQQYEWSVIAKRVSLGAGGLNVRLPRIDLVKTSGLEEFDLAYTRGRAIFIPERLASLAGANPRLAFYLLAHELFHVVSRFNPAQRDALYALLAFERVAGFEYPEELEGRRLSNPDAFEYAHVLSVQTAAGPADVLPINQSLVPLAEVIQLPSIFAALDIVLLAVDAQTGEVLRDGNGAVVAYNFGNTDWVPRMLRNSDFIIHPEEVMADNFATLMEKRANGVLEPTNAVGFPINDPGLLTDIEQQLTAGCL